MCGIAGILRWRRDTLNDVDAAQVVRWMTSSMAHRGPDADKLWADPQGRCVLGHRRLSIIDTSDAGLQPMATSDGRWLITFNGEIYNFQELRPILEAAGVRLRGRTDTEVLIEGIAQWGTSFLARLDGMFAFAAFDTWTGEMLMARDPFGEKPLYYSELGGGGLAFASELQALELLPRFDGTVNIDAIAEVLSFQYIGAPRSIYRSVKKLQPGHWLRVDAAGKIDVSRYYEFKPGLGGFTNRPVNDLVDELEDILVRSISRRMISDVPLGAFLSGGVDSSTVCALIRHKLDRPLKTFSMGFHNTPESEHLTARAFAQHLGTEHHDEILTPNAAEFLIDIGKILDEPNADSSCLPTYLLSRFARRHVTVAVSGDGGDEMFGGYGRYISTLHDLDMHRSSHLSNWQPGPVYFGDRILVSSEPHIEELFDFVPQGFAHHLGQLRSELNEAEHSLLCAMRFSDVSNYLPGAVLPKVDRMSMRHSLEVRTPFLNTELAQFAERLPDSSLIRRDRGKIILRELAYRYLPRQLIDLPKQGFGLPMSDWGQTHLLAVASQLIESDDSRLRAAFGANAIGRFMIRQRSVGGFATYQVWAIAMLESWLRNHPAKIPPLEAFREAQVTASQATELARGKLRVLRLEKDFHVVGRTQGSNFEVNPLTDFQLVPREYAVRAFDLLADTSNSEGKALEALTIEFPEWGKPLTPRIIRELSSLRGSAVSFIDPDSALHIDYAESQKLEMLGITRAIFRDAFNQNQCFEIDFQSTNKWTRLRNLYRLFRERIGFLSNVPWMRLLGANRFKTTSQGWQQAALIRNIEAIHDTDLVSRYMVFEGTRQLPPVHVSHVDIRKSGGGRYSIWNQTVCFSPTNAARLTTRPYWVVPLNERTEHYLPMVPRPIEQQTLNEEAIARELEKLLKIHDPTPFTLKPGDHVVVCTHALPPGGAERQWVYLAEALSHMGFRVTMVTYEDLEGQNSHYLSLVKKMVAIEHVDASRISIADQLRYWPRTHEAILMLHSNLMPEREKLMKLNAAFSKLKPIVVFAQLDMPNLLAGIASHLAGVSRVVLSFRNYNPSNFPYLYCEWLLPAYQFLSKSDRVFFSGNSRGANTDYANWIGIPIDRVAYIPNAIDPDIIPTPTEKELVQARATLGIASDTPVILGVMRLQAEKDPATFVEVCARIAKEFPNMRALIAGIGPMQGVLEAQIASLGLGSQLFLLGRRSDVNVLMSLATLLLLPSQKEGMPNVVLEAQLMGTPIVATRAGATSDAVLDGETAILRPIGDVEGLARACIDLIGNPTRARAMGQAGQRFVRENFRKEKFGQCYLNLVQGEPYTATATEIGNPPMHASSVLP